MREWRGAKLRMLKRLWRVGGASEAVVVDRLRQFVTWNLGGGKSKSRSGPFLPFGTGGKQLFQEWRGDLH